jgi:hypothetical protein
LTDRRTFRGCEFNYEKAEPLLNPLVALLFWKKVELFQEGGAKSKTPSKAAAAEREVARGVKMKKEVVRAAPALPHRCGRGLSVLRREQWGLGVSDSYELRA